MPVAPADPLIGGLREYVLSVELVTGGGEIARFGSKAVKDVAGYEVIGLLIGGGGRYGMITEVTLRLLPARAREAAARGRAAADSAGLAAHDAPAAKGSEALERLAARVQKVFDPAEILRW